MTLFRQEVIEAKRRRLFGDVKLSHPPSLTMWVGVLSVVSFAVIAVLAFGTYIRKETVRGYLSPEDGIIHIYAASTARITKVFVREGDTVKAGTVLLRHDDESSGSDTGQIVASHLAEYEKQALNAAQRQIALGRKTGADLARIKADILHQRETRAILDKRIANQKALRAMIDEDLKKYEALRAQGFASDVQVQAKRQQMMQVEDNISALTMQLISVDTQISALQTQTTVLTSEQESSRALIDSELSSLSQRRTDLNAGYQRLSRAPVDSVVAGIQVQEGQVPVTSEPLMSLMPAGSRLDAELLVPTRAAGFISVGDEVRLQVDAYPYQNFGFVTGRVRSISRTALRPSQFLAPIEMKESFYRIRVALDRDFVMAYGSRKVLRPGMSLTADIVTDRRRIWRQFLDPVLAAGRRAT